ncbi:MAG: hypothetical protein A2Y54_06720 [Chloroflexi bacterium RBG_16_51_16]|nr:MAG: hypothetical protein A2Y54_06720 [Chloroflexi bacterium RBG_16_51_16]
MEDHITLTVNGVNHKLLAEPGETLANLLRNRLRLTGTKIACEESECGACTVLVDGEPILSCMYPAERADGKTILTIEGVAGELNPKSTKDTKREKEALHPLQEASYCTVRCNAGTAYPGRS